MQAMLRVDPVGLRPSVRCHAKKVNDRGKVSSRPGPPSPREQKKARQAAAPPPPAAPAQQQQQPAAAGVALTPAQPQAASPAPQAPATPSASTPRPASPPAQPSTNATSTAPRETPQVVVDRIFSRMVGCAGVPTLTGIGLLVIVYFLKKQGGDDFPLWPAYLSQGFTLFGGLLGITYGALSASWDPAREGSLLGWTEFKANLPVFLSRKQ